MQSIHRALRIGQTDKVHICCTYIRNTIDDLHKEKHSRKVTDAMLVTGDVERDPMYINDDDMMLEASQYFNAN